MTSWQPTTSSRRAVEGMVLICSLWLPAIGHKEMEPSCIKENLRLDIRKWFFTEKVASHSNRLPREVIMAKSLPEFKGHMDDAFSHH